METTSSGELDTPPPQVKYKRQKTQRYLEKWESDPKFKGWLRQSKKGPDFFHCAACDTDGKAGKSEIEKHAEGKKHKKFAEAVKTTKSVFDMPSVSGQRNEVQVKEGEIRLVAFLNEHNIAHSAIEHLVPVVQAVCPDSDIAKKLQCGRTKCTAIVKNVLGGEVKDNIYELLRNNPFSLIADESTDKGCTKHLALVARVVTDNCVKDAFLNLIPLQGASATQLYEHVKNMFDDNGIPYKDNMVGFSADGASVMMGKRHSLSKLLKDDVPDLFVMKCICHSFHLCASYACNKLPRCVEDLARDIHNYFQSPKQSELLKEFQEFTRVKPHKMLHPSQTRWLSLHSVVKRLLEQLPTLKLFFISASAEDRLLAVDAILQKLNDPINTLYLEFLDYVLPLFNDLNCEMQAEKPKLYLLHNRVSAVFHTLAQNYMKASYLKATPLANIEVKDPRNFLPLTDVYFGGRVTISLQERGLNQQDIHNFRLRCLEFYIEGASQIIKRFNLEDPLFQSLGAMNPQSVISKSVPSIAQLSSFFPRVIPQNEINELDREWRLLLNTELNADPNEDLCQFWFKVSRITKGDDTPAFPLVAKLMKNLMCLPHSSAAVERVFSQINLMKTKLRNQLNTPTLIGMLHSQATYDRASCHNFKIKPSHLQRMTSSQLYRPDSAQ